jgi:outer membrane protein assembly factor BamB
MKTINKLAIVAVMLLTAATASAQRDHGPVGGTMSGGGMGGDMMDDGMGGMSLLVAPDGAVITSTVTLNSTTNVFSTSVVALSPTGSVAWRWVAPNGVHRLELAGNLVLVSGGGMDFDGTTTTSNVELTALILASGTVAWKTTLPGVAMSIEPAANQIVVLTMQHVAGQGTGMGSGGMGSGGMGSGSGSHHGNPGTGTGGAGNGMMNGARALVALSNSGVILWSVPLNQ